MLLDRGRWRPLSKAQFSSSVWPWGLLSHLKDESLPADTQMFLASWTSSIRDNFCFLISVLFTSQLWNEAGQEACVPPPFLILQLTCFSPFSRVRSEPWVIYLLYLLCTGSTVLCLLCAMYKLKHGNWQYLHSPLAFELFSSLVLLKCMLSLFSLFFFFLLQLYFAWSFLKSPADEFQSHCIIGSSNKVNVFRFSAENTPWKWSWQLLSDLVFYSNCFSLIDQQILHLGENLCQTCLSFVIVYK